MVWYWHELERQIHDEEVAEQGRDHDQGWLRVRDGARIQPCRVCTDLALCVIDKSIWLSLSGKEASAIWQAPMS